jgi:hypothetical protein
VSGPRRCQGLHPGVPADYYDAPNGDGYCRPCAAEKRAKTRPRVRQGASVPDRSWIDMAECAGALTDAWFAPREDHDPGTHKRTPNPDYAYAKSVCRGCPMADLCLEDALAWESKPGNMRAGIYGGLDAEERKQLLKDRRSGKGTTKPWVNCGTDGGYYRHRRRQEEPCQPCKDAHRDYWRAWDRARREKEGAA